MARNLSMKWRVSGNLAGNLMIGGSLVQTSSACTMTILVVSRMEVYHTWTHTLLVHRN